MKAAKLRLHAGSRRLAAAEGRKSDDFEVGDRLSLEFENEEIVIELTNVAAAVWQEAYELWRASHPELAEVEISRLLSWAAPIGPEGSYRAELRSGVVAHAAEDMTIRVSRVSQTERSGPGARSEDIEFCRRWLGASLR